MLDYAYSAVWSSMCTINTINKSLRNGEKKKKEKLIKDLVFTELRCALLACRCIDIVS